MPKSIEQLRRDAKALRRAYESQDSAGRTRVSSHIADGKDPLRHADFLAVPVFGRLVSVVLMVLGRLEIYPILLALVKLPIPRARPTLARLSQLARRD